MGGRDAISGRADGAGENHAVDARPRLAPRPLFAARILRTARQALASPGQQSADKQRQAGRRLSHRGVSRRWPRVSHGRTGRAAAKASKRWNWSGVLLRWPLVVEAAGEGGRGDRRFRNKLRPSRDMARRCDRRRAFMPGPAEPFWRAAGRPNPRSSAGVFYILLWRVMAHPPRFSCPGSRGCRFSDTPSWLRAWRDRRPS